MKSINYKSIGRMLISPALSVVLLVGCVQPFSSSLPATPIPAPSPGSPGLEQSLSSDQIATLSSLQKVDEYPLYVMHYTGTYPIAAWSTGPIRLVESGDRILPLACQATWGCSLFTAYDGDNRLYGRNFDWRFSPAVILFTDPPDGYASVSMVDIDYLGFGGNRAGSLTDLPLSERRALLNTPFLPFDGMNERGLVVGMAAVPAGEMRPDPQKKNIDSLMVIREILDHASTVEEAVDLLGKYNIDMGGVPLHYLVASASGDSALVEFYQGKMVVSRNTAPWQHATNFLVASTNGSHAGQCDRYDRMSQQLGKTQGRLSTQDAFQLLSDVSQAGDYPTQWSIVYGVSSGEVSVAMGRKYAQQVHTFRLYQAGQVQ